MADRFWLAAHGRLIELHVEKSATYGVADDRFSNFTAVAEATGAPPERYALERIVEKATRALNMIDAGQADQVVEYPDLAALALCCEAMQTRRQVAALETAREYRSVYP
jgi:hypothetical protein